jgi:hypothetical protein
MSDQLDAGLDAECAALEEHYRPRGIGALSSAVAERLAQPMHPLRFQGSWFTLACELTLDIRDRARCVPQAPPTSPLMSGLSSAAVPSVRKRWLCKTNAGMQCVSAAYHTMPTGHAVTICSALKASSKRGNADPAHRTHELNIRCTARRGFDATTRGRLWLRCTHTALPSDNAVCGQLDTVG